MIDEVKFIKELNNDGTLHDYLKSSEPLEKIEGRLSMAWFDRELIVFIDTNDRVRFVVGLESRTDRFPQEVFIEIDVDMYPETVVGDIFELRKLLNKEYAYIVGFGDMDPEVMKYVEVLNVDY